MILFKLRVVGGPLLWEALGHGLLGLGLKRALLGRKGQGPGSHADLYLLP